ncbi:MAG: response regulator transcription factor [Actinomycetota bacterium]
MRPTTIAIVEDEDTIASALALRLEREGFRVERAADGPAGVELCLRVDPDLVVLDLMLPGFDGLEVCRRIQEHKPVPVIMLTARDSETDVLVGLGVGADDYITKPFSARELVARIHALLRRIQRSAPDTAPRHITWRDVVIDAHSRRVTRDTEDLHLTATEFDLLTFLAREPDKVFTREDLLNEVWGYGDSLSTRTIDTHVRSLRRKLGGDVIRTVHGVGYAIGDPT